MAAMAEVHFTSWLRELVPDGPLTARGGTVGDALAEVFAARPQVRGYVLDDRGRLRKHVCVFVDGARLKNAEALGRSIGPAAKLHVMQALSGG
jgi:molybdopterin synthase sulfur carrier subunit